MAQRKIPGAHGGGQLGEIRVVQRFKEAERLQTRHRHGYQLVRPQHLFAAQLQAAEHIQQRHCRQRSAPPLQGRDAPARAMRFQQRSDTLAQHGATTGDMVFHRTCGIATEGMARHRQQRVRIVRWLAACRQHRIVGRALGIVFEGAQQWIHQRVPPIQGQQHTPQNQHNPVMRAHMGQFVGQHGARICAVQAVPVQHDDGMPPAPAIGRMRRIGHQQRYFAAQPQRAVQPCQRGAPCGGVDCPRGSGGPAQLPQVQRQAQQMAQHADDVDGQQPASEAGRAQGQGNGLTQYGDVGLRHAGGDHQRRVKQGRQGQRHGERHRRQRQPEKRHQQQRHQAAAGGKHAARRRCPHQQPQQA